ncbi:MAG TPA: hypothetical protein VFM32_02445 [Spongiibacteraceae bacterium]|nr:hypothetical protein [Spongiibacteraceae bacterium]
MNTRGQLMLLWTAPVAGALFLLAYFLFPGFWPPMSPTLTPEQVAAFFREHVAGIRGVAIFCNIIAATLVPLFAVIAVQMLRVVNSSPVFAYSYIICVGIGMTEFILADYAWAVAAFRPDRDPQLISLLNDMAWFFFIAPVGTIAVQNLCLAMSIYLDARPRPVFPRWVAHFNIATALLMSPGAFSILHKTGPLAWNGSLSFSLRLITFAAYVGVMFFALLRIVKQQVDSEGVVA